ncbi:hypothetical protein L1049_019779 [Liquidambar formosana]|uniref:F-box domain-containing protein n=1 Tax=Liquidambar formosana TaxID=63359 RepID=A0AAP0SD25_LIQFO
MTKTQGLGHKRSKPYILRLPSHVIGDIFCKLPIKTLIYCRCVCKAWRLLLLDPNFAQLHFATASSCVLLRFTNPPFRGLGLYDFEDAESGDSAAIVFTKQHNIPKLEIELSSSFNGLLCFRDLGCIEPLYVSNPITGEYMTIPTVGKNSMGYRFVYGFGISPNSSQCKVIRISTARPYGEKWEAMVYALGAGAWRSIGDVPYQFFNQPFGACLNGALHWRASSFSGASELICCFDLENEEFRLLPLPPCYHERRFCSIKLGVLGGCLYMSGFDPTCSYPDVEIWVMKEYGVEESWTKEIFIKHPKEKWWEMYYLKLIKVLKNGEILLLCNSYLVWYNPGKESFRRLEFDGVPSTVEAISHVPSFVSLKDVAMGERWRVFNARLR